MDPFVAHCAHCGKPFMAHRATARYCGGTCKQRARRARGDVVQVDERPAELPYAAEFLEATRRKLDQAGVLNEPLGLLAMVLAEETMNSGYSITVRRQWSAMFRGVMADALRPARRAPDELARKRSGVASSNRPSRVQESVSRPGKPPRGPRPQVRQASPRPPTASPASLRQSAPVAPVAPPP